LVIVSNGPGSGDGVSDGSAGSELGLLEGIDEFVEESQFAAEEGSAAGHVEEE
jgi:hypothetical protein